VGHHLGKPGVLTPRYRGLALLSGSPRIAQKPQNTLAHSISLSFPGASGRYITVLWRFKLSIFVGDQE
jgi:hypothetical protein